MSASPFDSPTVCEVTDIFYAERPTPEDEPDWAAIRTRLMQTHESLYTVAEGLLRVVWQMYEDPQSGLARLYAEKHGLI